MGLIDKPAEANSLVTDVLISQGAIPFVKTNVAQDLMVSLLVSFSFAGDIIS